MRPRSDGEQLAIVPQNSACEPRCKARRKQAK